MDTRSSRQEPRVSHCRITTLRQSDVGVLTVRWVVAPVPQGRPDDAELVFVPHDDRHGVRAYPLRRVAADDGALFEAEVRLCDGEEPLLPPGTWDLGVRFGASDTHVPLCPPSHGDSNWPRIMVPGPAGPYRVSASAKPGAMLLRVEKTEPYVEVGRVEVDGASLRIEAHLVPDTPYHSGGAQLVVQSRERKEVVVRQRAELTAGRMRATVDLDRLRSENDEIWDIYLHLGDDRALRLGAHLDEIRDKQAVFSFPGHVVERSGNRMVLRPFYSVHNELSIRVRPERANSVADTPAASPQFARARRPLGPVAKALTELVLSLGETVGRLRRPRPSTGKTRKVYFLIFDAHAIGGIVRTIYTLANHLAADHDVEVIAMVGRKKQTFFRLDTAIKLTVLLDEAALSNKISRGPKDLLCGVLHRHTSWMTDEKEFFFNDTSLWLDLKLLQWLHRLEPGVLVTTTPSFNIAAARFARRGIVTIGQEHLNFTARKHLRQQVRRHYPKLDALTVLTRGDEEDYGELLVDADTRVRRIPNGLVNKRTVCADLDRKRVIAAGRYSPQKGFDLLVPAYQEVARKHPDWQLRIYGQGLRGDRLRRRARHLRLHNHVLFVGPSDQLDEELARSSIFVLSSRAEGFPMVLIEAMAVGLPVVSFDCPRGPSDIITDGVDGTLVPFGDVDGLTAAILDLVENPDKRRAYSEAALRTAKSYDIDVVGQAWRRMFDELVGPAPQGTKGGVTRG